MSLYGDYIRERDGFAILEDAQSFATYEIKGSNVYIRDIYVIPELRKTKVASLIADRICTIAKSLGCNLMIGTVDPKANGADASMKVLIAYGCKLLKVADGLIVFSKEI